MFYHNSEIQFFQLDNTFFVSNYGSNALANEWHFLGLMFQTF